MIYPLYESREVLWMVTKGLVKGVGDGGKGRYVAKEERVSP